MEWLRANQDVYYERCFGDLTQKLLTENIQVKGSLNSLGRKLGVTPPIPATYQLHNTAEMFRVSVLSKTSLFLQNELLQEIIMGQENPTPMNVLKAYKKNYPQHKAPTYRFIEQTINRLTKTGVTHGTPTGDGVLNFWATDMHYSKVTRAGHDIYFTLKLENIGLVTLKFRLPNKTRFEGGKITRPTVYLDQKGEIRFGFTIQKDLPKSTTPKPTSTLGIDLGLVEPFVGTVVFGDGTHSSPYLPNRRTNYYARKIQSLKELSSLLFRKQNLNEQKGHESKSLVLKTERLRLRSKISRLKIEQSHALANQIVAIANHHNAIINLEKLNWVPNSSWDQARQQDMIEQKARTKNIKVRKINPKNTSNTCPRCGNTITHSARATHCINCSKSLNRDILASRNIAQSRKPQYLKQRSIQTRVSYPATTGNNLIMSKPLQKTQTIQQN